LGQKWSLKKKGKDKRKMILGGRRRGRGLCKRDQCEKSRSLADSLGGWYRKKTTTRGIQGGQFLTSGGEAYQGVMKEKRKKTPTPDNSAKPGAW